MDRWRESERSEPSGPPGGKQSLGSNEGESSTLGDDTYSVAEAARVLGLSTRRIRQMIGEGKLAARRTSLGAFRLPGKAVRLERQHRASPQAGGTLTPSGLRHVPRPQNPVPKSPSRNGPVASAVHRSEVDDPAAVLARGSIRRRDWGKHRLRLSLMVVATGILIGLVGVVIGWALGSHPTRTAATDARRGTRVAPSVPASTQNVVMLIDQPPLRGVRNASGKVVDAFVPSEFSVREGIPVAVTVFNYSHVPHTFTSPGLGIDQLVPPAPAGGPSVVTFTFTPGRPGSYRWHCRVPCDPWSMATLGYMRGTVRVMKV